MHQDDLIFSFEEKTKVRFSWEDVYRQAGHVIRHKQNLPDNYRLYIPGSTSNEPQFTMKQYSETINRVVDRYVSSSYR